MKVLSLFSGIGAFEKALDNLQIPYELAGFSEIDKYAVKSYCAIHGVDESMNLRDITKIDEKVLPKDIDLITYGFPCQDISIAGEQKGLFNDDGTQTRSGLFFEALRVIETTQPRVAIAENVKNLTGKKFKEQFALVLESLDEAGYNNYWKVLNAKDYGIPQNRERVFIISIRKDIDRGYEFPKPFPLQLRLKDMLEDEVDEIFYISDERTKSLQRDLINKDPRLIQVGNLDIKGQDIVKRVYSSDGLSPTLTNMQGGNRQPKVAVAMRGRYNDDGEVEQQLEISDREYANSITTVQKDSMVAEPIIQRVDISQTVKVRKYHVDCKALCECLREHKSLTGLSNKAISEAMDVPVTKVEHWFRQDDCFAIPEAELWVPLKELLHIETGEFDESIMTFEEKEGVYEKSERHYSADGIAPTLTSTTAAEKIIVREATKKGYAEAVEGDFVNIGNPNSKTRRGRVGKQVTQTLTTSPQQGVVTNKTICLNSKGGRGGVEGLQPSLKDRIYDSNGIATACTTSEFFLPNYTTKDLRIRKLTPKECWRLMGFDDEDFYKAEAVNSNTQLYKQAGNSIVVDVLEAIFTNLKPYLSESEVQK